MLENSNTFNLYAVIQSIDTSENILNQSAQKDGVQTSQLRSLETEKVGGLIDLVLGSNNNGDSCKTCGLQADCPTHPSYAKLECFIFHPTYYSELCKILNIICIHCFCVIVE